MNKIKEKKLNNIKSQISEIANFVQSNSEDKLNKQSIDDLDILKGKQDDTIILTNIIDQDFKNRNSSNNLYELKKELDEIKTNLTEQRIILDTILTKLS